MKRLLTLIALIVTLGFSVGMVKGQDFFYQHTLPPVTFTLSDVIDILSDYDVRQEDNKNFCQSYYGLSNYNIKQIDLCSTVDHTQRKKTLLHELLHIRYHQVGIETGGPPGNPIDFLVNQRAEELFHQLYGLAPASPSSVPTVPPSTDVDPQTPQGFHIP